MALDELDHELGHAICIFSKVHLCETSLYIAKDCDMSSTAVLIPSKDVTDEKFGKFL